MVEVEEVVLPPLELEEEDEEDEEEEEDEEDEEDEEEEEEEEEVDEVAVQLFPTQVCPPVQSAFTQQLPGTQVLEQHFCPEKQSMSDVHGRPPIP